MYPSPSPQLAEVLDARWDRRLRVFRAGDEVDTCALVTQRYVVLIDTMAAPELSAGIVEAVREELVRRHLLVVNTHADWDHSWGNATFEAPDGAHPAPIVGHTKTAERLRSEETRRYLAERQREEVRFAQVRLVPPTLTFEGTLRIAGGDLTLDLISTPGHTEDHVSVWVPELRLLLAGDAAEHPFPYVERPEGMAELRRSLERLAALEPAMVIPCHGGTTDPELLQRNLAYFAELEQRGRSLLQTSGVPEGWERREDLPALLGLTYEEAVQRAGADPATVPAFYHEFHLAAARATVAALRATEV